MHFKALDEAFEKPSPLSAMKTKKIVLTKEQKEEDKEWDKRHAIYEKERLQKKEAIQKWIDEGRDYDKHPFASRKDLEDQDELDR